MTAPHWYRPGGDAVVPHAVVLAEMARAPVVLLGETHDRADIHRWQLHVAAGLLARREVVLGFEMFPARLDPVLADWVAGRLSEEAFLERAEWGEVWGFPAELYLPLFRFCRDTGTRMIGLNCRRGLVREVGKGGWDSVPEADREGLTPARPSSEPYRRFIFDLARGVPQERRGADALSPEFTRFIRAQEVWDRSFATRIAGAVEVGGPLVVGIIGKGHLQFSGGVSWQLADLGVTGAMVAVTERAGAAHLEEGAADYVAVLPGGDA
ncbi:ChaN family lipoprotein [Oceanicola sp. 22II-s10i]|uniref:ChaN family lipoprotein n=1 Tax=Oceanicola sp. 22II-s10i TaxID=1317116 RepID=UPI000B51FC80|nr:ChaN family lipoprotein [Oceanicola sp. 22II-s10i]